jgi:hypothetical protein
LRIVDNDHISSTVLASRERATVFYPFAFSNLVYDPSVEGLDLLVCETLAVLGDSLEDIVVVLGDAEDVGLSIRDVPGGLLATSRKEW